MIQNRRQALSTLSGLFLTACGGGDVDAPVDGSDVGADVAGATRAEADAVSYPQQTFAGVSEATVSDAAATTTATATSGSTPQFLVWDAGSGPNRDFWSGHLGMPWKNRNTGDWLDAAQVRQGASPFATFIVSSAPTLHEVDVTRLAQRWVTTRENRGAMLRGVGSSSSSYVTWSGREGIRAPLLVVTTELGTYNCKGLLSSFSPSTAKGLDTRARAKLTPTQPVIVQFDLSGVRGATVRKATMQLNCEVRAYTMTVNVFEVDAPRFQLGANATPRMGIAAGGEAALKNHPSVIRAGDFSNLTPGVLFDTYTFSENPHETLPDPDAPGTIMFRGSFTPVTRGSFSGRLETMRAKAADPLRPPATVTEELYCRMYIYLEDDWNSTLDANKMAIGWDMRMGWWNDAQGGYWQATTGNGGAPGTGLKVFAPARKNGSTQIYDRWEYQGHSVRMEASKSPGDGNPYSHLRPLQSYVYNLDQPTEWGDMVRLGNAVISKGRWHCIEQQIKVNSVTGPYDSLGNGTAVPDGILRTWVDGVLVSEITRFRWRRNREMGVQGPWVNWFYGGKLPTETPMHYRMNHFVCAREYIGPRVG